jgi:hypothetical protein
MRMIAKSLPASSFIKKKELSIRQDSISLLFVFAFFQLSHPFRKLR